MLERAEELTPDELGALAAAYEDQADFALNVVGDITFAEPARWLAGLHAGHGAPTYLYRFSVVSESMRNVLAGTPHAQERQYVFDNLSASPWPTDANDQAQASLVSAYWIDFATRGDPNGDRRPRWSRYPGDDALSAEGDALLDFTNAGPVMKRVPFPARMNAIADWRNDRQD